MRLRTFTAATMAEAMRSVRLHLGPEAVIVATEPGEGSCTVIAAIEDERDADYGALPSGAPDPLEEIAAALDGHGVPLPLAQRLGSAVLDGLDDDPAAALATALAARFRFAPIELAPADRLLLVGPPGAGKTVTAAKLAAREVLRHRPVRLVSTDVVRAGGVEQLEALARVLTIPLGRAEDADALARIVDDEGRGAIIIDSPGFNPYRESERCLIRALAEAATAEPVLILPAGMDLSETADTAASCAEIGCRRLIVTRLDLARRLGGLLAAAEAGDCAFAEVGIAPDIADGLCPLTPLGLARLLLPPAPAGGREPPAPDLFDRGARP